MGKKGLIGSRKRRKAEETFAMAADQSKLLGVFILALLWLACVVSLVLPNPKIFTSSLVLKQRAPKSVFTDFGFSYENIEKTLKKQEEARAGVPLFYKIDSVVIKNCLINAKELFDEALKKSDSEQRGQQHIPEKPDSPNSKAVAALDKIAVKDLSEIIRNPEQRKIFFEHLEFTLEQGVINRREKENHTLGQQLRIIDSRGRIKKQRPLVNVLTPEEAAKKIASATLKYYSHDNKRVLEKSFVEIILAIIGKGGNLVYNEKLTKENKDAAVAQIRPVMLELKKGQPIVAKGQVVTEKDLRLLEIYSLELKERTASSNFWRNLMRSAFITFLMMIVTGIYISHIHPEVTKSNQKMWVIGTVAILAVFMNYSCIRLFNLISPELNIPPSLVMQIIPLALPAILLSALLGLRVAVYGGLFVTVIAALMVENSFDLMLEGLLASCVTGFAVRNSTNYRSFFLRSIIAVPLSFLALDLLGIWDFRDAPEFLAWMIGLSFVNGILTAILALVLLFVFESLFQVSTNMTLLTLCDYNHPLLKRLQFEAPGTYHHSIMVSTLAEQAAQAIGANPIKARVGALFHDIGKLTKPEYFTENNILGDNKHKELHPRMSSLIILNHVKEGVDMALKYKLRKVIRDAIEQHHGTDMVYYFYKRAIEENREKNTSVEEQEYRYPGPLPREKEVALVSLADACEAASRTLQKASHAKIDALVWEIFRKRLRDGQLNDAELTFGELAKVRKSFVKTLSTMLHGRVPYPKEEEEENEDDLFMASKKVPSPEKEGKAEEADPKDG